MTRLKDEKDLEWTLRQSEATDMWNEMYGKPDTRRVPKRLIPLYTDLYYEREKEATEKMVECVI